MKFLIAILFFTISSAYAEKFFQEKFEENDKVLTPLDYSGIRKSKSEVYCMLNLLKDVGWFIADGSKHGRTSFSTINGKTCDKSDVWDMLFDLHQIVYIKRSDLEKMSSETLKAKINNILNKNESYCGYKMLIGGAANSAVNKYTDKGELNEAHVGGLYFSNFVFSAPNWKYSSETCAKPTSMPTKAITCTYGKVCNANLSQGLMMLELAMLYESYNLNGYHDAFDEEFHQGEMTIGNMSKIWHHGDNPFHHKTAKYSSTTADVKANGIHGLRGAAGYLVPNIDALKDMRHYFMIYDATKTSTKQFTEKSLSFYNQNNRKIANGDEAAKELIYEDAFYNETKIYSYQYGAMSLGELIGSLSDAYPKSSFSIKLYKNVYKEDLYPRYQKSIVRYCRDKINGSLKCSKPKLISTSNRSVTKEVICENTFLKPLIISSITNCHCHANGYQAPLMPGDKRKISFTCNGITPGSFYSKNNIMRYTVNNRAKSKTITIKGTHKY